MRRLLAVLVAVSLLAGCGIGSDDEPTPTTRFAAGPPCEGRPEQPGAITVGSTNFSEQIIIATLYARCLEAAGYQVQVRTNLGPREVVEPALERGEIDLYPEYLNSAILFVSGQAQTATDDPIESAGILRALLEPKGIAVLQPAPATDQNGFAVTRATADKHKLRRISDLQPIAPQLVFGAGTECDERLLCLVGLRDVYGLDFKEVKELDAGGPLTKSALDRGVIDVGLVFTSDGAIAARGFVVLEDDKGLQKAENVTPVIRAEKRTPDVERLLEAVSAKLTTHDLSELNKAVDIDKAHPRDAATRWLREQGLIR